MPRPTSELGSEGINSILSGCPHEERTSVRICVARATDLARSYLWDDGDPMSKQKVANVELQRMADDHRSQMTERHVHSVTASQN